jgi:MFS family permease/tetratricopeptide (TPR) repeat protein
MRFPKGLRALEHRDFRLFMSGQLISVIGTWMQSVAQSWLVLELTGSAFKLGVIGALQFGPMLLFSMLAGAVADRVRKRRMIVFTQTALMLQAFVLALLCWSGRVQYWHVACLAFCYGLANTMDVPVRQAFMVEMVEGQGDLPNAIALNSAMFSGARMIGPAVAGLVIARYGVSFAFALNGLSFLAVIFALSAVRAQGSPAPGQRGSISDEIAAGLNYARHTPVVALVLGLLFCISLFVVNHNVMVPLLARNVLHLQAHGFGLLMSALGGGAMVGALTVAHWGRRLPLRLLFAAALLSSGLTLALGAARSFPAAAALLALMGFFQIVFMASCNTTLQEVSPPHLRGRVMSLYAFVFAGITPLSLFMMGTLAQCFGVPVTYALGGGLGLAGVLALAWLWARSPGRMGRAALAAGAVLLLLGRAARAQAGPARGQVLLELLELPQVTVSWDAPVEVMPRYGFILGKVDWKRELSRVQERLGQDPAVVDDWLRLGDLQVKVGDVPLAKKAYEKAVSLIRERLRQRDGDFELQMRLAEALSSAGRPQESQAILGRLSAARAQDWRLWSLKGTITQDREGRLLLGDQPPRGGGACAKIARRSLDPETMRSARALGREAGADEDRAVALAPEEPEAYMGRINWRLADAALADCASGKSIGETDAVMQALLSHESVSDIGQVARLNSKDYRATAAAVMLEFMNRMRGAGPSLGDLDTRIAALKAFQVDADSAAAGTVSEVLGVFELIVNRNSQEAEKDFRRALSLDPSRAGPWNLLSGILGTQQRWPELEELCLSRMKSSDSPMAHSLLAYALWRSGDFVGAVAPARLAAKMAPDDFRTHWRLGAALLRSTRASALSEAKGELDQAWELSAKAGPEARADLAIARAIADGLAGDQAGALNLLAAGRRLGLDFDVSKLKALRQALGSD